MELVICDSTVFCIAELILHAKLKFPACIHVNSVLWILLLGSFSLNSIVFQMGRRWQQQKEAHKICVLPRTPEMLYVSAN